MVSKGVAAEATWYRRSQSPTGTAIDVICGTEQLTLIVRSIGTVDPREILPAAMRTNGEQPPVWADVVSFGDLQSPEEPPLVLTRTMVMPEEDVNKMHHEMEVVVVTEH
jgi:hypothetical protein